MIKKGNVWGIFFSDIHLYKYQESTECNMNFKDLTFVKLSADCATKGTKDAVILMKSQEENRAIKKGGENIAGITNALLVAMHNLFLFFKSGVNAEKMAFGKKRDTKQCLLAKHGIKAMSRQ